MSSLSKLQIGTLGCILDVLQVERPDFNVLTVEQNQALIECFNSLVNEKGKGKKGKSKKSKEKSDNPKPGNSWIAWLKENRESIKEQNGGKEEGLPALLSKAYNAFKETPAFNALKKDCDEKMKEYKEKSNASANASDDDEPKKKTKKVEKSSEEKKPLNVYMAYCMKYLDDIRAYASESGKSFNEAKQEMYAKFKETREFKTLEAKCKADLKIWNEKAPKKQAAAASESDSDSDDEVVVAPKPVVQKPKTKKKEVVSSESESVPVKKADEPEVKKAKKDKKNAEPEAKKTKKDKKNADEPEAKKTKKDKKKADEPEVKKADKKAKKDKKKEVVIEEVPPEDDEPEVPPEDDEPEEVPPVDDEPEEITDCP